MESHTAEAGDRTSDEDLAFVEKKGKEDPYESEYSLLTKEDLLRIDREQPRWRWFRVSLIVIFWVLWVGLIVAAAVVIVLTPRCPPRPQQKFWQSKTGYWLNPFTFRDADSDLVGDLKGVVNAAKYVQEDVGAGFVILTPMSPIFPNCLTKVKNISFYNIHPKLGSMGDFTSMVKAFAKSGLKMVVTLNFNSVPVGHELAKPENLIKYEEGDFCRSGSGCAVTVDGIKYYSTYGNESGVVDLNLKSPEVLEAVKNVTRFWLSKGADGILLADAAFYVKDNGCITKSWLERLPECKLYTPGTLSVIQEIRKVVDEVSSSSSRPRVLIADPGNTGYGAELMDKGELLLGNEEAPGAHLVVSRQFAFNRGFHSNGTIAPQFDKYFSSVNASLRDRLALSVASPSDKPYSSVFSTASVLLLPGTPLIYAGSELGWAPGNGVPPKSVHPFGEQPIVGDVASHMPMPWNSNGGFNLSDYSEIRSAYNSFMGRSTGDTVETATAAGRGPSIFYLTKSLVELRKKTESLLWGDLSSLRKSGDSMSPQVFIRNATGFDSVVVVMAKALSPSSVINFALDCAAIEPLLVYPPDDTFQVGVQLAGLNVYFKSKEEDSLYVFKCQPSN